MIKMGEAKKTALIEAGKEIGRWAALGVVSYFLTVGVIDNLLKIFFGMYLPPEIITYIVSGITAGLRGVDKFLHEWGKEVSTKREEHWATGGLVRF